MAIKFKTMMLGHKYRRIEVGVVKFEAFYQGYNGKLTTPPLSQLSSKRIGYFILWYADPNHYSVAIKKYSLIYFLISCRDAYISRC